MRRGSSPATYSRCWTNSTDCPKYGLLCSPDRNPSTTFLACNSSREILAIASGCKNLLESRVTRQFAFFGGGFLHQPLDHLVGGDAFALGREVCDDPMPEHGSRQGGNVVGRHIAPSVEERPGF